MLGVKTIAHGRKRTLSEKSEESDLRGMFS